MRTLDGLRMNSAYNVAASTRYQVNQVMVQEIVLDTSAASVETESSGMNMNVVPKDGGNLFSATFTAEGTNNKFQTKDNISDELRSARPDDRRQDSEDLRPRRSASAGRS